MKKILKIALTVAIIVIMAAIALAGCSQVSQLNKLQAPWANYERYTYELTKSDGTDTQVIGQLVMTVQRLINAAVAINGDDYTVNGAYATMHLDINAGDGAGDSISSQVVFNMDFTPVASYRQTVIDGVTNTSYVKYNTSKKKGTLIFNGEESVFKQEASYYDNEMIYLLIRASDLAASSYSVSFAATNNIEGGSRNISATKTSDSVKLTITPFGEVECANFALTAAADYGDGTILALSIAKSPLKINNDDNSPVVVKPIMRIAEGAYTYTLKNISLTESAD